VKADGPQRGA